MHLSLLVWLAEFFLLAGLLGRCMYTLLSLTDLQTDMINPYDLSNRLNRFVTAELVGQVLALVVPLFGGMWFVAAVQAAITAYLVDKWVRKKLLIDATEAFRQLKPQQQWRMVMFVSYAASFLVTAYRLIETIVHKVLTPEGREVAKKLFREAATSLHGY